MCCITGCPALRASTAHRVGNRINMEQSLLHRKVDRGRKSKWYHTWCIACSMCSLNSASGTTCVLACLHHDETAARAFLSAPSRTGAWQAFCSLISEPDPSLTQLVWAEALSLCYPASSNLCPNVAARLNYWSSCCPISSEPHTCYMLRYYLHWRLNWNASIPSSFLHIFPAYTSTKRTWKHHIKLPFSVFFQFSK